MKRVVSEMHMKDVTIVYGMTETSPGRYVQSEKLDFQCIL
jgi:long-subunit acyl-CoA synthetase (AMP-forming)